MFNHTDSPQLFLATVGPVLIMAAHEHGTPGFETHKADPTTARKHLKPRSLVAPNVRRSGCREGTSGQDGCMPRHDDRVFRETIYQFIGGRNKVNKSRAKADLPRSEAARQNTCQNRCPNSPRSWACGKRSVCPRRSRARLSRLGSTAGKTGVEDGASAPSGRSLGLAPRRSGGFAGSEEERDRR